MVDALVEETYEGITVPGGDPEGLTGAATRWSANAGALERLAGRIDALPAALASWRGPASVAFGAATLVGSGAARAGAQAFDVAATTARAYAQELSDAQDLAREAINEAIVAKGRIRKATGEIEAAREREAAAVLEAAWAQMRIEAAETTALPLSSGARGDKAAAEGRAADARADERRWRQELTEAREALRAAQRKGRRAESDARKAARAAGIGFSAVAGWVPEIPSLGPPASISAQEAEAITFAVDLGFARTPPVANTPARYAPPDVPAGLMWVPRSPEQRAREGPPMDDAAATESMLATLGLIPGLGIPADIAGAMYSAARGDGKGAGLSLGGIFFEGADAAKLRRLS